jgi:hypothetical protein
MKVAATTQLQIIGDWLLLCPIIDFIRLKDELLTAGFAVRHGTRVQMRTRGQCNLVLAVFFFLPFFPGLALCEYGSLW